MPSFLLVFIGGGLGAAARYALGATVGKSLAVNAAWAVLAVNVPGCLLAGIAAALLLRPEGAAWRLFAVTGFLGGFTTYSTFMVDFIARFGKSPPAAAAHLAAHVVGGLLACLSGMAMGVAMGVAMGAATGGGLPA